MIKSSNDVVNNFLEKVGNQFAQVTGKIPLKDAEGKDLPTLEGRVEIIDNQLSITVDGMVYRYFRHAKSIDNFPMRNLSENLTDSQKETLFGEIVVEELVRFKFDVIIGSFLDGWNYEARIATQTSVANQT